MRNEAIQLEEQRLREISEVGDYQAIHERHRIFPAVFEDRQQSKILDVAAGVGVVGKRIKENYNAELLCNDICPKCLSTMEKIGLSTVTFDIDNHEKAFPFEDGHFDAVIALATIEHLLNIDHFVSEVHRILRNGGYFYVSAPNYAGLTYLLPFILTGKTFHNPLHEADRYEFYAHVRYFTYQTLLDYVGQFGFMAEAVYLPLPHSSSRFQLLREKSKLKATAFRSVMNMMYRMSPRWSAEPVLCFKKQNEKNVSKKMRKVIL
jgi:2-polyprenyl-3-methyl-5-hydroxy-6-metoxy-1,4-benzoquinol methylase